MEEQEGVEERVIKKKSKKKKNGMSPVVGKDPL